MEGEIKESKTRVEGWSKGRKGGSWQDEGRGKKFSTGRV